MADNSMSFDEVLEDLHDEDAHFAASLEDMRERSAFRDWLRAQRSELGLTQARVAELVDLSQPTISDFEGPQMDPSTSKFQKYARALGIRTRLVATQLDPATGLEHVVWTMNEELCRSVERTGSVIEITSGTMLRTSGTLPLDGMHMIEGDDGRWSSGTAPLDLHQTLTEAAIESPA